MKNFLEYIMLNYTWFLGTAIIILLAIIGSYADKTNFGQGKPKEVQKNKPDKLELPKNKSISDYFEHKENNNNINKVNNNIQQDANMQNNYANHNNLVNANVNENLNVPINSTSANDSNEFSLESTMVGGISSDDLAQDTVSNNHSNGEIQKDEFDKKFDNFDEEFNEVLPQKDIIDNDLLSDIDDLSFDKTQRINVSDIPDLDDVELPEIKKISSDDENIWDLKK